jgi:hypothetical protein
MIFQNQQEASSVDNIVQFIKFLKSAQSFQERKQRQLATPSPAASAKHGDSAQTYSEIIGWFENYLNQSSDEPSTTNPATSSEDIESLFSLNPLDVDALPEEFRSEITISDGDKQDAQVVELLRIANRPLALNELLVGCWRKYEVQHKRNQLTARLYRLARRGDIFVVGKGTYSIRPESDASTSTKSTDL